MDCRIDCQTLMEALPEAARAVLTVASGGRQLARREQPLPKSGKIAHTIGVGPMTDGATYEITAAIVRSDGQPVSTKREAFTRKVMPFEKAPPAGLADLVPPPFTPPTIGQGRIACIGRTYAHGGKGLLESLVAADRELLAAPATLKVKIGDQAALALAGDTPTLTAHGKGQVACRQTFSGPGLQMEVDGTFDYDGFYRFSVRLAPGAAAVDLKQCYLELPIRESHATLLDAPVEWMSKDWRRSTGFLDAAQGRLWDSKRFPFAVRQRKGNMPPYCWIGDDDRGLCYSCASDQGMHNDDALPAVTIDREGRAVVLRAWFVNKPLTLGAGADSVRVAGQPLQAPRSSTPPVALRRGPTRLLLRRAWPLLSHGLGNRLLLSDVRAIPGPARNAEAVRRVRESGYDFIAASASSCSECGGTPSTSSSGASGEASRAGTSWRWVPCRSGCRNT